MSGLLCIDRAQWNIPGEDGLPAACLSKPESAYPHLITYKNGRVADLTLQDDGTVGLRSEDGKSVQTLRGVGDESVLMTLALAGLEIGNCGIHLDGLRVSRSLLQMTSGTSSVLGIFGYGGGHPISWGPEHLREIYRVLNQSAGQSGNAFLCSNRENRGQIALNNGGDRIANLRAAITALERDGGSLDRAHRTALLESLRTAAGVTPPQSHFWSLFGVGVTFTGVGLATHGIINRKGPPRPPGGGGSSAAPRVAAPEAVADASASSARTWLTAAGGLLAAGAALFLLRRTGVREASRPNALRPAAPRPAVREANAGNGGFNVFDLMGATAR